MKNLLVVANWKENKTVGEAIKFFDEFKAHYKPRTSMTVVICPSFTSLQTVWDYIQSNNLKIDTGVQNISRFEEGPHTGEISAREAAEFAKYVIVGHSERRILGEGDEDVQKKVQVALKNNLQPIVCVMNENVPIPTMAAIVAYEPREAIGTGNPDTPENAEKIARQIKNKNPNVTHVLYGGSVTGENVRTFTEMQGIDGVLVGGASLDPITFSSIITAC